MNDPVAGHLDQFGGDRDRDLLGTAGPDSQSDRRAQPLQLILRRAGGAEALGPFLRRGAVVKDVQTNLYLRKRWLLSPLY